MNNNNNRLLPAVTPIPKDQLEQYKAYFAWRLPPKVRITCPYNLLVDYTFANFIVVDLGLENVSWIDANMISLLHPVFGILCVYFILTSMKEVSVSTKSNNNNDTSCVTTLEGDNNTSSTFDEINNNNNYNSPSSLNLNKNEDQKSPHEELSSEMRTISSSMKQHVRSLSLTTTATTNNNTVGVVDPLNETMRELKKRKGNNNNASTYDLTSVVTTSSNNINDNENNIPVINNVGLNSLNEHQTGITMMTGNERSHSNVTPTTITSPQGETTHNNNTENNNNNGDESSSTNREVELFPFSPTTKTSLNVNDCSLNYPSTDGSGGMSKTVVDPHRLKLAAVCLWLRNFLDNVDGILARQQRKLGIEKKILKDVDGHFLDATVDTLGSMICLFAIFYLFWQRRMVLSPPVSRFLSRIGFSVHRRNPLWFGRFVALAGFLIGTGIGSGVWETMVQYYMDIFEQNVQKYATDVVPVEQAISVRISCFLLSTICGDALLLIYTFALYFDFLWETAQYMFFVYWPCLIAIAIHSLIVVHEVVLKNPVLAQLYEAQKNNQYKL